YRNEYLSKDLVQVWATTENNSVNHAVYKDAKSLNLSVNVVDDQPYCDFITPSMINRGKIQIAISSGGASPVLVRNIRQSIEANLPQNTGLLAEFAAGKRDDIKLRLPSVDLRRVFWEQFLAHPSAITAEDNSQLDALYQQLSANDAATKQGSLTFIEIPNAVDLITLRTLQTLQKAEMVLYPQQCDYALVDIARRDADRAPYEDFEDLISRLSDFAQLNLCVYVTREQMDAASSVCSSALRLYSGH
ncbi:NAD(P)-dependent oxidoreductase, partial [Vibrio sp. FNV 38]|nr:NAD(P)-dependent oxidoreductase [Vibrio sp. FNV 38]